MIEPVLDKDKQLVVPQGSVLVGHVTTAKAARSLGRNGKLRFTFQQVQFPEGSAANRPVEVQNFPGDVKLGREFALHGARIDLIERHAPGILSEAGMRLRKLVR